MRRLNRERRFAFKTFYHVQSPVNMFSETCWFSPFTIAVSRINSYGSEPPNKRIIGVLPDPV